MMTAVDDKETGMDQDGPAQNLTGPLEQPAAAPDTSDVHTYIGARLRKAFDDVASQPVPERFLQLMRDLDRA